VASTGLRTEGASKRPRVAYGISVRFRATSIAGAWTIEDVPHVDERGWFARTFCAEEFSARGIDPRVAQTSLSYNEHPHTLRGLHLQRHPHGETKLVRCLRGLIFDVLADLRPDSPTYRACLVSELSEDRAVSVVAPPGVAHGFMTLSPGCLVSYQMSEPYLPEAACGVRWDDPELAIPWPFEPSVMSEQDRNLPLLSEMRW